MGGGVGRVGERSGLGDRVDVYGDLKFLGKLTTKKNF